MASQKHIRFAISYDSLSDAYNVMMVFDSEGSSSSFKVKPLHTEEYDPFEAHIIEDNSCMKITKQELMGMYESLGRELQRLGLEDSSADVDFETEYEFARVSAENDVRKEFVDKLLEVIKY